jgi:hypothetical protein
MEAQAWPITRLSRAALRYLSVTLAAYVGEDVTIPEGSPEERYGSCNSRSRYLCDDLNPLSILWRPIRVDELSDHGPCAWAGRTVTIGYNATALPK